MTPTIVLHRVASHGGMVSPRANEARIVEAEEPEGAAPEEEDAADDDEPNWSTPQPPLARPSSCWSRPTWATSGVEEGGWASGLCMGRYGRGREEAARRRFCFFKREGYEWLAGIEIRQRAKAECATPQHPSMLATEAALAAHTRRAPSISAAAAGRVRRLHCCLFRLGQQTLALFVRLSGGAATTEASAGSRIPSWSRADQAALLAAGRLAPHRRKAARIRLGLVAITERGCSCNLRNPPAAAAAADIDGALLVVAAAAARTEVYAGSSAGGDEILFLYGATDPTSLKPALQPLSALY